jgi:glycosyltransferase involved in cell wall biosynthesis
MRRIVRFLWRCIPQQIRYRLYARIVHSSNFFLRNLVKVMSTLTLQNSRWAVTYNWPEVHGADRIALVIWAVLLRFHDFALNQVWERGHLVRRVRRPRPANPANRVVLHCTGSFDLGGTQTQIKHLCLATHPHYEHRATEIFPEMNYLYRRDVQVDPARYVKGGLFSRTIGRLVVSKNYRSSPIVQIYKLMCDIREENAEVVVGWGHEMCVTAFIAAAFARVPHIVFCIRTVDPSNYLPTEEYPRVLRRAHRRMLPMVSKTIVNSTLLQADHAAWVDEPKEEIAVCANGIDITPWPAEQVQEARTRIRRAHGIDDGTVAIVNVGRFSLEKGQASIVEANRLLLERGTAPPFVWLLCGDGPTLPDVKGRADALGMTNIKFLGRTDRVREILCAGDIFVMPSDFEGMPNAMMEAMTHGLACVSTNRTGALDVARPGVEALYYEPRNALHLAMHLQRLLDCPRTRAEFGAAAESRIGEFSVRRTVETFEGILDGITARGA